MAKEWTKEELVKYYQENLRKVKKAHDPKKAVGTVSKERCREYIEFAKKQLDAVKKGRKW